MLERAATVRALVAQCRAGFACASGAPRYTGELKWRKSWSDMLGQHGQLRMALHAAYCLLMKSPPSDH